MPLGWNEGRDGINSPFNPSTTGLFSRAADVQYSYKSIISFSVFPHAFVFSSLRCVNIRVHLVKVTWERLPASLHSFLAEMQPVELQSSAVCQHLPRRPSKCTHTFVSTCQSAPSHPFIHHPALTCATAADFHPLCPLML